MAIFINQNRKVKNIFINVNGEKKSISSAWVNKDGVPTKIFQMNNNEKDQYDIAPANTYSNWNYTLDDTNNIITLNYYTGSETDIIVYTNYVIDGVIYKTKIKDLYYSFGNMAPPNHMFSGMGSIKTIKFSENIDMSNVKALHGMFFGCKNLTSIEGISNWDLTSVTDMDSMFSGCESLTKLDLSNWKLANVKDVAYLFNKCKSLTEVNMNNWNTSSITHMNSMFSACSSLIKLDISNWDTSGVIYMGSMFIACTSLTSLDLSSFDTRKVTNMDSMFRNCSNLTTIYATNGKWSTSKATTYNMFDDCGTSSVTYR